MREGIPLRVVVIGSVVLALAVIGGSIAYFFWLRAHILQDRPMNVVSIDHADDKELIALVDALRAARAGGGVVTLREDEFNWLLFGSGRFHFATGERIKYRARISFAPPFVRLLFSEPEGERWLNADLIAQPYAADGL